MAVVTGVMAGSISLVGFGIDSFIEVTSGSVLLWRMSVDADAEHRERNERRALQVVGICFLFLAAYIAYESAMVLWSRRAPERSIPGIVLACVSLIVPSKCPLLLAEVQLSVSMVSELPTNRGLSRWLESAAKDEALIHRHAELSGFPATRVTEIGETIDPTTACPGEVSGVTLPARPSWQDWDPLVSRHRERGTASHERRAVRAHPHRSFCDFLRPSKTPDGMEAENKLVDFRLAIGTLGHGRLDHCWATTFTRMPLRAFSSAADLVSPITPCLLALYVAAPPNPSGPQRRPCLR
jgi:hypothetical protein